MHQSKDLKKLLQIIGEAPSQVVKQINVLDDPVRIYLSIKAMYHKFKRENFLEHMQSTVLEVRKPIPRENIQFIRTEVTAALILLYNRLS
jgi:hypothetical protein